MNPNEPLSMNTVRWAVAGKVLAVVAVFGLAITKLLGLV